MCPQDTKRLCRLIFDSLKFRLRSVLQRTNRTLITTGRNQHADSWFFMFVLIYGIRVPSSVGKIWLAVIDFGGGMLGSFVCNKVNI